MAHDTFITNQPGENVPDFARAILKNWHFVIIILGLLGGIVVSWTHFETGLQELKSKVTSDEIQASVVEANVNAIAPQLSAANAKLDILLKHSGL